MSKTLTLILARADEKTEQEIKEAYQARFPGREWRVTVDPSIVGGFKIIDGDYIYDSSVAGQLNEIKRELLRG